MDEQAFERMFNGSPVRRAGFVGLRRNIVIAMANSGAREFAPRLARVGQRDRRRLARGGPVALKKFNL